MKVKRKDYFFVEDEKGETIASCEVQYRQNKYWLLGVWVDREHRKKRIRPSNC